MKSEVRSLEQAVCALVTKLDLLLTAELGLQLFVSGGGLHISTPDHLSEHQDAFVTITPAGWPKDSHIQARFYKTVGSWSLYEGGQIWADHLTIPVHGLHFKPADSVMGIILEPTAEEEAEFVNHGYRQLIVSLEDDLNKIR